MPNASRPALEAPYVRRHLRVGWWTLLLFSGGGLVLETLHGFKIPAYLDLAHENRRLMWTLAHSHGTLLGLLNVAFALCVQVIPGFAADPRKIISATLMGATVLLPGGFLVAGLVTFGGDPGPGIVVLPFGAVALIASLWLLSRASSGFHPTTGESRKSGRRGNT